MNQERNPVWIALALAAVGAAVVWLVPRVEEELAPELKQAWVAIEVEGEGFAEVGWRHLERGTPFTLHAVLEAQNRKGEKIYYTEAPALRISGEDVPVEALRPWDRRRPPKILWFTVEAGYAFRDITAAQQLERFDLAESFRPAWPQAWSIPGELVPSWVEDPKAIYGPGVQAFGTQRFHVRLEVYADDKALLPEARFKSWGAESVAEHLKDFPTVTVYVPGRPKAASEIFGLPQLEPPAGDEGLLLRVSELSEERLAFSRLSVAVETFEAAGIDPRQVQWRPLDLGTAPAWGPVVETGDLLQVAERLVMLFDDRGEPGILDGEDLCFDFAQGAAVRPLDQVFGGDGEVSWASLGAPAPAP